MFYRFHEIDKNIKLRPLVGKKAESLVIMAGWGLPVPGGGVITTDGFDAFIAYNKIDNLINDLRSAMLRDNSRVNELAENVQRLFLEGDLPPELKDYILKLKSEYSECHFAVRSSGSKEDLENASFAGQYSTILNVKTEEELFQGVKECWASLFNDRVLTYCINKKIDFSDMKLAVIIQKMIPSEKSGVIFSVSPLKGYDKQITIEACFGLGELLVGGEITPDFYRYDWYNGIENDRVINDQETELKAIGEPPYVKRENISGKKGKEQVLDLREVKELSALTVNIQAKYGFPVDIEWAKHKGKFYILQSRPITTISYSGIKNEWTTADFRDGGVSSEVCSPLMWSLYDLIWEDVVPQYSKETSIIEDSDGIVWGEMFYGRPYWNLTGIKDGLKRIPGFIERAFDESLGIQITYDGNGYVSKTNIKTITTGIKVLFKLNRSFKELKKMWPLFNASQEKKLADLSNFEYKDLSRDDFFEFYEQFILEEYYLSEYTYFKTIFASSNMASLFKEKIKKIESRLNYPNLISGLKDLSHLIPMYELWELKEKIKKVPESASFWRESSVTDLVRKWRDGDKENFMGDVHTYIDRFKFHSVRELDITYPCYGEDPSFVMESIKNSLDLEDKFEPQVLNDKQYNAYIIERKKLLELVPIYKRTAMDKSLQELREILWWREELRDLSTQYYYYVRIFTLHLAKHFKELNIIKAEDDIFFIPVKDIISIIHGKMSTEQANAFIWRNRQYYQSFRNYNNPNEIGNRYFQDDKEIDAGKSTFSGIPCSSGSVTGKVKVIKDIHDASRIEKGDILITRFTDPGWTPKFSMISAVVTESGGLLSHAAVISREYGIPAVLAVDNITSHLQDGQEVTVDGDKGLVII